MRKGTIGNLSTFEKYSVVVEGKPEEIVSFSEIRKRLISSPHSDIAHNNLFLGNGFNLSIGIQTSHKNLGETLGDIEEVEKILPGLKDEAGKPGFNIEKFLPNPDKPEEKIVWKDREIDAGCVGLVQREFFRILIAQIKNRFRSITNQIMISFLADFESIFTTNYDPMLYLLSDSMREGHRIIKKIMRDNLSELLGGQTPADQEPLPAQNGGQGSLLELKQEVGVIREGSIIIDNDELAKIRDLPKPLGTALIHHFLRLRLSEKPSKKLVDTLWELAVPREKLKGEIRGTAPDLINKKFLDRYDGFEKPEWEPGDRQNLFYLHGAFHLYAKSKKRIYKVKSDSAVKLIEALSELKDPHLSIFQPSGKEEKIKNSDYLIHCSKKLRKMEGPLCIIGWQCDDSDRHLARRIAKSDADPIFVSVYREEKEQLDLFKDADSPDNYSDLKKTVSTYRRHFRKKELVFFDIGTIDYLN